MAEPSKRAFLDLHVTRMIYCEGVKHDNLKTGVAHLLTGDKMEKHRRSEIIDKLAQVVDLEKRQCKHLELIFTHGCPRRPGEDADPTCLRITRDRSNSLISI